MNIEELFALHRRLYEGAGEQAPTEPAALPKAGRSASLPSAPAAPAPEGFARPVKVEAAPPQEAGFALQTETAPPVKEGDAFVPAEIVYPQVPAAVSSPPSAEPMEQFMQALRWNDRLYPQSMGEEY